MGGIMPGRQAGRRGRARMACMHACAALLQPVMRVLRLREPQAMHMAGTEHMPTLMVHPCMCIHLWLAVLLPEGAPPPAPACRYTTRVINESMRLYPQPPVLIRRALQDDTFDAYTVPAGSDIFISVWNLHRWAGRPGQARPGCRVRSPWQQKPGHGLCCAGPDLACTQTARPYGHRAHPGGRLCPCMARCCAAASNPSPCRSPQTSPVPRVQVARAVG